MSTGSGRAELACRMAQFDPVLPFMVGLARCLHRKLRVGRTEALRQLRAFVEDASNGPPETEAKLSATVGALRAFGRRLAFKLA
jgi:hypothetical protein